MLKVCGILMGLMIGCFAKEYGKQYDKEVTPAHEKHEKIMNNAKNSKYFTKPELKQIEHHSKEHHGIDSSKYSKK